MRQIRVAEIVVPLNKEAEASQEPIVLFWDVEFESSRSLGDALLVEGGVAEAKVRQGLDRSRLVPGLLVWGSDWGRERVLTDSGLGVFLVRAGGKRFVQFLIWGRDFERFVELFRLRWDLQEVQRGGFEWVDFRDEFVALARLWSSRRLASRIGGVWERASFKPAVGASLGLKGEPVGVSVEVASGV